MAVLQMQRLNAVALQKNRKAILELLQDSGVLELNIKAEATQDTDVQYEDVATAKSTYDKRAVIADQAIDIMDRYVPEKSSLLGMLDGMPTVDRAAYDETVSSQDEYMSKAQEVINWEKGISEDNASIVKLENQLEALVPWMSMDVPMSTEGTKRTALLYGMLPEEQDETAILTALKTNEPAVDAADVQIFSASKDATYVSVLVMKEDAQATEEALRKIGFSRPSWQMFKTPAQEQESINKEIESLKADIQDKTDKIASYVSWKEKWKYVADYYRMRADKYGILGELPHTENTFALSGYVPAIYAKQLEEKLTTEYDAYVEIEEIGEKEEAPVMLKNNKFSEAVEGIVASYGLPRKGEIDPTFIASIFYIVFFGMMLSDAGYGLLMAIALGIILVKFKNMKPTMRKSLKMFFWGGISTIVWGFLFGGFFGDAVGVISQTFGDGSVALKPIWFDPLGNPMQLLLWCLVFGLIHMFIGLGIAGYMLLKKGDVKSFICDILAWYLFLIGLIGLLVSSSIYKSMATGVPMFENLTVTGGAFYASVAITLIGGVIILVMSGRRKKSIGMRLMLGIYDIYGITSWLSDWLSYSRLLALGLATGCIGQVINMICKMLCVDLGLPMAIGAVLFVIIFIIGHVANMAINLLSAYVHSNRLEYVEFFGKFYTGGAKAFEPIKAETKYVQFAKNK